MFGTNLTREYEALGTYYEECSTLLAWPDAQLFGVVRDVSGWSPGQHLYHIMLANELIFRRIHHFVEGGEANPAAGRANLAGQLILRLGRLPRGRARSPKPVEPPEQVEREDLEQVAARSRQAFAALAPGLPVLPALKQRAPHPALGMLSASQWLRFARIHSRHHITIIRDIAAQQHTP